MQQNHRATAMRRHSLTSAITITLALGLAGPALAQQAAPADRKQTPTAQELDVVTVTANKRTENIREVATAVTKLSAEQIENINATQMSDYANYVPGLQVQDSGSPGQTQVSMRGIAPLSSGSTVGTYVDEAPLGSNNLYQQATLFALDLLPYDIDSIEVLRGPQGTLYGAGAMGGLIKYVMKKPDTTQNEFRVGMGIADTEGANGPSFNYRAGGNLVLAQDEVALRASFATNEPNGYVDNLVNGREDINDASQASGRASFLFKTDKASVQFALMKQKIDSPNNSTIALDPTTHDDIYGLSNFVGVDEVFKKDIENYALTVDYDLGFANLVSATSYSDVFTSITNDLTYSYGDYTAAVRPARGSAYITNDLRLKQFTQEVRLSSKADAPFEWLVGAFLRRRARRQPPVRAANQFDGSPLPAPFDSIVGVLGDLYLPSTYEETAVFGNAAYKFNDWFKLGAGVRWSRNKQEFTQDAVAGLLAPIGTEFNTSEEDVVTWSMTPQFQVSEDVMVYGKVSTGYQPGGPNIVVIGLPPQVDSSTLTSYEIGMKSAFADNRVLLDVVGYQIHWEDIQVASLVNGVSGLVNGGEATSQRPRNRGEFPPDRRPDARPQRGLQRREHRRGLPARSPCRGADPAGTC